MERKVYIVMSSGGRILSVFSNASKCIDFCRIKMYNHEIKMRSDSFIRNKLNAVGQFTYSTGAISYTIHKKVVL